MDIGSSGGETFMVAGNRVTVELALERSPHLCIPATLFSLNSEGSHAIIPASKERAQLASNACTVENRRGNSQLQ